MMDDHRDNITEMLSISTFLYSLRNLRPHSSSNGHGGSKTGQTTSLPRLPPSTPPMTQVNGRPRASKGRPPPASTTSSSSKQDKHKADSVSAYVMH